MEKIVFFIPNLCGGGAEKVLVNLCNALDDAGYYIEVRMLFNEGVNRDKLKPSIKATGIFSKRIPGIRFLLKCFNPRFLSQKLISTQCDDVVSYLEGTMTRIVSGLSSCNHKIAWIHSKMTMKDIKAHFRSYEEAEKCYKEYNKIVAVSIEVKQQFESLFPSIPSEKIFVQHNVNETDEILRLSTERIEEEIDRNALNAIIVGKVAESKGSFRILPIFDDIEMIESNLILHFIGTGPDETALKNRIIEKGLQERIKLHGYQENPYKWIVQSDFVICPSYTEGLSTVVTEALILGKPILTTDCGGMHELLGNSEYGYIVANTDEELLKGLKTIVLNPDMRTYYSECAKERGRKFMKKEVVDETIALLEQI